MYIRGNARRGSDAAALIERKERFNVTEMKRVAGSLILIFLSAVSAIGASKGSGPENKVAPVVMTKMVVSGRRLPSGWFTIAWECKGSLPLDRIKKAWVSNLLPGSPADLAGVQIGDRVLSIDGQAVDSMNGLSLRTILEREHDAGTRMEFLLQQPGEENRLFVVKFEQAMRH